MKKLAMIVAASLLLTGCAKPQVIDGKEYPAYGLLNESTNKSEKVCYETKVGAIVAGVIFIETIIVPIVAFGYRLNEPVRAKGKNGGCGIDDK
jgi:starvation-inducible outer membrane lipoprotein